MTRSCAGANVGGKNEGQGKKRGRRTTVEGGENAKYEVSKLGATGLRKAGAKQWRGVCGGAVRGGGGEFIGVGMMWGIFVVVLFVLGVLGGGVRAADETEKPTCLELDVLKEKMPDEVANAKRDGCCYLMRWKGCRIIAVVCSYETEHVPLLFVNADKRDNAVKAANELAKMIPCSKVTRPFDKREPWVAIISPCLSESQRYTPNVLLYPDGGRYTRFIGWQGKMLRVQPEDDPEFGRSKRRGTAIEIVLDVTQARCLHSEFRPQKGRMDDEDEIKEIICARMTGVSSYMPEMSGRDRKEIRGKFPGAEVLAYSAVTNTCIVRKGRNYHAGNIEQVSEYLTSARSVASFEYPAGGKKKTTKDVEREDKEDKEDREDEGLAVNHETSEGETKPVETRDGGEEGLRDGTGERAEEEGEEVVETPPKTVREAIDNYIRMLNEM